MSDFNLANMVGFWLAQPYSYGLTGCPRPRYIDSGDPLWRRFEVMDEPVSDNWLLTYGYKQYVDRGEYERRWLELAESKRRFEAARDSMDDFNRQNRITEEMLEGWAKTS